MALGRTLTWLGIMILVPIGLLVVIPIMTAPVLHPNPPRIRSMTEAAPPPKFVPAVERAQKIVRERLNQGNLPGISVAVGAGGGVVWAEGFGYADIRTGAIVTPRHRFRIGTASTVLTSAAAGLLLEEGRLKLDDEIQRHVPAFPKKQWPVRLADVMGHTAGLISDGGGESPLFNRHCKQPVEALAAFAGSALLFEPGTQYSFSSYGWILMSGAIEAAAGRPFLAYMQERIFDPLGMRDTVPDSATFEGDDDFPLFNFFRERIVDPRTARTNAPPPATNTVPDLATTYFPRFIENPRLGVHLMRPLDLSCYAGSSAFLSTPSDLVRFAMAINGGKLLRPATVQSLQTQRRLASGESTGYGLGWNASSETAGHNGELHGGMTTSLVTFPGRGMAVAVVSNIAHAKTFDLAMRIAEAFEEQGK